MRYIIAFIILITTWVTWSGQLDLFHLSLGVISSLIVAKWSTDLFFAKPINTSAFITTFIRFEVYSFWLLYEILLANLHVIYVAFHPQMDKFIKPQLIEFTYKTKNEMAQFILGQSITLTPGTVTINIHKNKFLIHALTNETAEGVPGILLKKVKKVFK